MKKNFIVISTLFILIPIFCSTAIYAQRTGVSYIKVGYFNPKDVKGGLIFGGMLGSAIDQAVDVGIGLDIFRGSNKSEKKVDPGSSTGGLSEEGWIPDAESSVTIIPATLLVNVKFPASHQLSYTGGGGIGYGFLWAKEKKYDDAGEVTDSKTKYYHGFRWMLTAGILYKLGSRSSLILEAFYDGSKLSRKEDNITYKVNPSGLGIRVGLRFGVL